MKRKLLILSVLAICIATLAAGTLAYFTSEGKAHNVITTGGVDIEVREWANDDKTEPFEDLTGVMPGTSATKIAEVANTGASEAWIRVRVEKDIRLPEIDPEVEIDPDVVALDIDTVHWTDGGDGYFYYNEPVKPGEVTAPVFTAVTFAPQMGNEFQNATATVDVSAQAVQTANNGDTVMDAKGWPNP